MESNTKSLHEKNANNRGIDNNIVGVDLYRMNEFVKKISNKSLGMKHIKILDIGSRNGWLKRTLDKFENINIRCVTLDISDHYVDLMKKDGIEAYQGDICDKTIFKDNIFDIIVMGEIIEHLPDTRKALLECRRILKKDGIIIGSVPNVWNVGNLIRVLFRKDTDTAHEHVHFFDKHHLRNMFEACGYRNFSIDIDQFSCSFAKFPKLNSVLAKLTNTGTHLLFEINR